MAHVTVRATKNKDVSFWVPNFIADIIVKVWFKQ